MLLNEKDGERRGGAVLRSTLRLLPVFTITFLLVSFQSVGAEVPTTSGSTGAIGNILNHGSTSYEVLYSYPSTAEVGTDLNISVTLHITAFTGVVEYIVGYALEAQLFLGAYVLNASLFGPSGFNSSSFLYPGAFWGPNNLTIPLTETNTGIAKGQSANATVRLTLRDTVYYGVPVLGYQTEPAIEASGGSLVIQNGVVSSTSTSTSGGGGGQTVLPYALLASGAVLMVAAVFLPRGPRSPQSGQR